MAAFSTSPYHVNAPSRSPIGDNHAHPRPWPSRLTQSLPGHAQTPTLPPYFGVILASTLKIEDSLAVDHLLAVMLAQPGHRFTPALLRRHEPIESRSPTSCSQHGHLGHDVPPACAAAPLRMVRTESTPGRGRSLSGRWWWSRTRLRTPLAKKASQPLLSAFSTGASAAAGKALVLCQHRKGGWDCTLTLVPLPSPPGGRSSQTLAKRRGSQ